MLKIKNWSEFQHNKSRDPIWIKLYRKVLDDRDIMMLPDRSFRTLVCLWLLASEDKDRAGTLPSIDDIAFRVRLSHDVVVEELRALSHFIVGDDINMISHGEHAATPETEKRQRREETEKSTRKRATYSEEFETFFKAYPRSENKKKAFEAWNTAKRSGSWPGLDAILAAVEWQKQTEQWKRGIIPHPKTWITGARWEDEVRTEGQGYRELITELDEEEEDGR